MLEECVSSEDFNDTKKKVILSVTLQNLQDSNTGKWNKRDFNLMLVSLRFLRVCFLHKAGFFAKSEFESVVPLCVEAIDQSPTGAASAGAFRLIKKAIPTMDRSSRTKSGVAGVLLAVWESDDVDDAIRKNAGNILKMMPL